MLVSTALQVLVGTVVVILPLLYVTDQLPEARQVMVFVAAAPSPGPPPPPPPPAPAPAPQAPRRPAPEAARDAPLPATPAPVAPREAVPAPAPLPSFDLAVADGVPGGVPGGAGLAGAVAGGGPVAPPPAPTRAPVRVGGNIEPPALLHRVQPDYPAVAVQGNLEGVVILEAIVDRDGTVSDVTVLRSVHRLLDAEAARAVRQWRYSPLVLNGVPERFVLTVTLSFHLEGPKGGVS
jgi:protein TonB